MTQDFLNGADANSAVEQVCRVGVAQRMNGNFLGDANFLKYKLKGFLDGCSADALTFMDTEEQKGCGSMSSPVIA